jgi:hypothetical protein
VHERGAGSVIEANGGPRSRNGFGAFGIGQWLGSPQRGILGSTDFDAQISHVIHEGRTTEARAWAALRDAKTAAEGSRRQHV